MKTKIFYLAMYILAVLPLMTACESDDPPAIDEPTEQTQLATPVVTVNVDGDAKTIIASWQAVENADNYHYKISGDETLYETGETRLELQPYSKFEGGSHSITVQAVSNAQPDLFSPSEWGKADFSVESAKLQTPDALNADVNKESCTVTVSWAPVANAVSYLYKIDDGEEVPVSEPEISFSLFDYAPGEHSVSVKALAEGDAPTGRSASVKAVTAVASSDWSEVYTFTITDEPLPGVLGNKPLDHARLGDFYLNDGSLLRGDSKLSEELADACIGIVFAAGQSVYDKSDYSATGINRKQCHGYVVALQDATSSYSKWGTVGSKLICYPKDGDGKAQDNWRNPDIDWSGYAYTQTIITWAGGVGKLNADAESGYPATYYVVVWYASIVPAPTNSSGWFLPSIGQLWQINQSYKNLPFTETGGRGLWNNNYWSSSEFYDLPSGHALVMDVLNYDVHFWSKNENSHVRAVLAF